MIENGYSICFNEWALDKEIKSELGLLLIVSSLTAESGYCYASNEYFSKLFDIDEVSVSRKLKKLENLGYITIEYEKRGCEITKRKIRLTKMLIDGLQKNQSTINKNVKENNISNKIISNNNSVLVEKGIFFIDDTIDEYKEVLSDMREKEIDDCWEWIINNKYGQTVSKQWVIDRLNQFKGGLY